jgi:tRNA1Val (adenine37-N6)-methyltransferase
MAKSGVHFHFKHFSVRHDVAAMKVGTDGVLLGAWAAIDTAHYILDIGTGSGVIALMLAQRSTPDVVIDAIELEATEAELARENVDSSPWPAKVNVYTSAIQDFRPGMKYDAIVSNPPYFIQSQESPDLRRTQSRHTVTLSYPQLLDAVEALLTEGGTFHTILPYTEGLQFITLAADRGLRCTRQWSFRTRKEKPIERWLLEFSRTTADTTPEAGEILLYDQGTDWSDYYRKLTTEFYLNA